MNAPQLGAPEVLGSASAIAMSRSAPLSRFASSGLAVVVVMAVQGGTASASGGAGCPAASISTGSCLVMGGADFIGPPQNLSRTQCCAACAATADKPPAERCAAFQWNYAGNSWGEQVWNANHSTPGPKCSDQSVTCCLLLAGATKKKQPVHPMQAQCDTGIMPPPPAPPWPASPPAGAKNVLYVLIDDLRTQMTPFGHAEMKTPHFAAFADSAVLFEQAHCNSQMCVPTRNR